MQLWQMPINPRRSQARPEAELRLFARVKSSGASSQRKNVLGTATCQSPMRTRPFWKIASCQNDASGADGVPHGKSTLIELQQSVSMRHFYYGLKKPFDISGDIFGINPSPPLRQQKDAGGTSNGSVVLSVLQRCYNTNTTNKEVQ